MKNAIHVLVQVFTLFLCNIHRHVQLDYQHDCIFTMGTRGIINI